MTPSYQAADKIRRPAPFLATLIATGLFTGYTPWAPGTVGTVVGLLLALIPGMENPLVLSVVVVAGFFGGVITSARVAQAVGRELTPLARSTKAAFQPEGHETADPSVVVIDEIVGMWTAILFLPRDPLAMVFAFVAFRVFDIVKPPPARQAERIPGGWGIMLDDVVAGIYANIAARLCLMLLSALLPPTIS